MEYKNKVSDANMYWHYKIVTVNQESNSNSFVIKINNNPNVPMMTHKFCDIYFHHGHVCKSHIYMAINDH